MGSVPFELTLVGGMAIKLYTEEELKELCDMPKRVTNPGARWLEKPTKNHAYRQRSFKAKGEHDENRRFEIYQRENIRDDQDFSCGIAFIPIGGSRLTLARYNGPSHPHGDILYRTHIHRATVDAIAKGKRPEREAKETDRYDKLSGALACLIKDFNLSGFNEFFDQLGLPLNR